MNIKKGGQSHDADKRATRSPRRGTKRQKYIHHRRRWNREKLFDTAHHPDLRSRRENSSCYSFYREGSDLDRRRHLSQGSAYSHKNDLGGRPKITSNSTIYSADVLLIDEISLIRIDTFDFIVRSIEAVNDMRKSNKYLSDSETPTKGPYNS